MDPKQKKGKPAKATSPAWTPPPTAWVPEPNPQYRVPPSPQQVQSWMDQLPVQPLYRPPVPLVPPLNAPHSSNKARILRLWRDGVISQAEALDLLEAHARH